jgi:CRISPR-associated protein Cmr3
MMNLFLHPEDVLLFRDGKPFNSGEDHHARSLFPPLPSVMQGAIRSHYLVAKGIPLNDQKRVEETVGTAEDFKTLRLRGPFIARYDGKTLTRYFPTPADAFAKEGQIVQPANWKPNPGGNSHSYLKYLPFKPDGIETSKDKLFPWMREDQLQTYLNGGEAQTIPEAELFHRETRLGIKLQANSARATEEGMLYQAEFIRLCPEIGLYLELEGYDDFPDTGLMRIGGEGHGVMFHSVDKPGAWQKIPDPLPKFFKIYFATPTFFENGWQPKDWGNFFEGQVTLEGVAFSGSLIASGFDYAKGEAKPARRFVPAGSVYCFSSSGAARLKQIDGMSDYAAEIGFGQFFITEWKKEK